MNRAAIGQYKIQGELGRGGMGEVYLAHDTRLDRQVAIKALPVHLAQDADRLSRFQREAKVLASLNHPGIAAIYGLEEADGHQYLVLEYVEGETMATRLERGPIPVDESLSIAKQITEALEVAHERGVIHRDLKPANVMLTRDGAVKVLDFGLARSEDGAPSSSVMTVRPDAPTSPARAPVHSPTIPGAIMGTAGYMSPEQARGKAVDKRSDIFSFGCVLYEMLTGAMPFRGETVADSIGATLHKDTDLSMLPAGTPRRVRDLLTSCLAKDRKNRLHDIGDARIELERAINEPQSAAGESVAPRRALAVVLPWLLVGVMIVVGATFPLWSARFRSGDAGAPTLNPVVRFTIEPPAGYDLQSFVGNGSAIAISPAGDRIVFVVQANSSSYLCVRELADARPRVLPNSEGCFNPFFSPDGKWLGFVSNGRLMKMPAAGGPPLTICDVASFSTFTWLDDGSIVWGAGASGLWRVSANGGVPTLLAKIGPDAKTLEPGLIVRGLDVPLAVGGASYLLASGWDGFTTEEYHLYAVSLSDGTIRRVLRTVTEPRLIAPDRLVFTRGTTVMTVGFDPAKGVVVGEPAVAIEGVRTDQWMDTAYIGASIGGAFASVPGGRFGANRRIVRVDATGKAAPLLDKLDNFSSAPAISSDGRKALITTLRQRPEMWVLDLERKSMSLVSAEGEVYSPRWSNDGTSILSGYTDSKGVTSLARWPLGGGAYQTLPGTTNIIANVLQELPDGSGILVMTGVIDPTSKPDIGVYSYAKESITPLRSGPAAEELGCISPDGKWIAYASDESGTQEVYIGPLGAVGPNVQVSSGGGIYPRFSADGTRLFFVSRDRAMMSATIEVRAAEPHVSVPTKLFETKAQNLLTGIGSSGFDVLPTGEFVLLEKAEWEKEPPVIHVILNWNEELRTKAGK